MTPTPDSPTRRRPPEATASDDSRANRPTPSLLASTFFYDKLGRPTTTVPPDGEQATTFTYVGLTQTKSVKGSGTDRIEATSYLDALGRPSETKRLNEDGNAVLQFTCYDG